MDIYLLEAIVNGILLGGVLALLALGLNLIFGVIDVVWIAYADLVMCGMYVVYWLYAELGWPLPLACAVAIVGVAALGMLVHLLIIAPILGAAPINQLLATGGLLFFLQSFATLLFGTDFRNIGVRLPIIEVGGIYISYARLMAFGAALAAVRCASLYRQYLRAADVHDLRARGARQYDRRLRRRLYHERDHFDRWLLCLDGISLRSGLHLLHHPDVHATARDSRALSAR